MRKITILLLVCAMVFLLPGCHTNDGQTDIVATTKPVYDFTVFLCQNTGIEVRQLVTENLSCLHDYTLQVRQMRMIEEANAVILSGAGLEEFLHDALQNADHVLDASSEISLICGSHKHEQHESEEHHHAEDPHIWLSVSNAREMVENIYQGLTDLYPEHQVQFAQNLSALQVKFDELDAYGQQAFSNLTSRELITFHDGFSYFAQYWDLKILHSLEEESGSEASAAELIELVQLVENHHIPAIFTEENGSTSAADIVARETGINTYNLSMGMSEKNYFEAMYHNIDTIKEALG